MEQVFFWLQIVGIIAFSVSGALVSIKSKLDVFGVIIVATLTSIGGGITRDLILGHTPPIIFSAGYLHLIIISLVTGLLTFIVAYIKRKDFVHLKEKVDEVNNYFDSMGLAVFTIMGVQATFDYGFSSHALICISLGVVSGVGGGVLRDVLTNSLPYIFTKHIYATASLIGAVVFYLLRMIDGIEPFATIIGVVVIFALRVLATKFHWKAPKIQIEEK